ncbi:MAG: transposase [Tepidisphaeraceae bacterium]
MDRQDDRIPMKRGRPGGGPHNAAKGALRRGDERAGNGICNPVKKVDSKTLKAFVTPTVRKSAIIVTDEIRPYRTACERHADHQRVNDSMGQSVNREGFTTNPAARGRKPLSMAPLCMAPHRTDAAVKAIVQISPGDVERTMGKPSKARPKLPKKD